MYSRPLSGDTITDFARYTTLNTHWGSVGRGVSTEVLVVISDVEAQAEEDVVPNEHLHPTRQKENAFKRLINIYNNITQLKFTVKMV